MIAFVLAAAASVLATHTPQGFRAGPAKAHKSLVEYASLHCPHCAHFSEFGSGEIAARVRSGKLRFEYRPFLIFPQDIPATLIARCVPAAKTFAFIADYHRESGAVTSRLRAASAELNAVRDQGMPALNRKMVETGGMKPIAARHGLPPAAVDRCVTDPKNLAWLEAAQEAARNAGVTGTPTFEFNGERVRLDTPEELKALLDR